MLIERQKRASRVRFRHPIRVVTLGGEPRVIRTLTANVSRHGLFLRMPEPLPNGTKVALSLEAGGRALALAQAEVVWGRVHESALPGRFPGCGVRFTEFMHPRARDLVTYLVENLDTGKPLVLAPPPSPWRRHAPVIAAAIVLVVLGAISAVALSGAGEPEESDDATPVALAAATPAQPGRVEVEPSTPPVPTEAEKPASGALAPNAAKVAVTDAQDPSPAAKLATTDAEKPTTDAAKPASAADATKPTSSSAGTVSLTGASDATKPTASAPTTDAVPTKPTASPPTTDAAPTKPTAPSAGAVTPTGASDAAKPSAPPTGAATLTGASDAAKPTASGAATPTGASDATKATASAPIAGPLQRPGAAPTEPEPGAVTAATKSTPLTAAKTAPERSAAPSRSQGAEPRRGSVSLPDGASRTLEWSSDGVSLRLSCGGHVARAFVLTGPSRAVFDLSGAAPSRSHQLAASLPHVKGVRIGKQPGGTRVVVDLSESPRSSRQDGATLVLSF